MASASPPSSQAVWGLTSQESRDRVIAFFLPTRNPELVRESRTREMEADMYLAIAVWLVLVAVLYSVVIAPFLRRRREGLVVDEDRHDHAD